MNYHAIAEERFDHAGHQDALMLNSVKIEGFKCFKSLQINDFSRFNFVVGDSAGGKTALLEALFFASSRSADAHFRTAKWRADVDTWETQGGWNQQSFDDVFRDLFYGFDINSEIQIEFTDPDSEFGTRVLNVFKRTEAIDVTIRVSDSVSRLSRLQPMVFKWTQGGREWTSEATLGEGKIVFDDNAPHYPTHFVSNAPPSPKVTAQRFSILSRQNRHHGVVAHFCKLFPMATNLSLEYGPSGFEVYVESADLPEKLPLSRLSFGAAKFLSIATLIASQPNDRLILIDEIENGLYFSTMAPLLSSILELCREHGTQLVATTHSLDFLRALEEVMQGREKDFSVVRLYKDGGDVKAGRVDGEGYRAILAQRLEVR